MSNWMLELEISVNLNESMLYLNLMFQIGGVCTVLN
jgi:hypothetical protein